MPSGKKPVEARPSSTDWEHVRREAAADAPIAYDAATDAESEPYDPNEAAAVEAYWAAANIQLSLGRSKKRAVDAEHERRCGRADSFWEQGAGLANAHQCAAAGGDGEWANQAVKGCRGGSGK